MSKLKWYLLLIAPALLTTRGARGQVGSPHSGLPMNFNTAVTQCAHSLASATRFRAHGIRHSQHHQPCQGRTAAWPLRA
ncbi:MAG: hypothetical protein M5R41_00185 [Bacteroidia bacterium]|nr:hypothetical protein [Bacteroidia bacterium]